MDASAEAKTPAAGEFQVEKNPQACFTGLPAELRLRIYGFLFSGSGQNVIKGSLQKTTHASCEAAKSTSDEETQNEAGRKDDSGQTEDQHASSTPRHRCCMSGCEANWDDTLADPLPLICPCFGPTFPGVLCANKLIYNEVMPVFYGNVEVRACLPNVYHPGHVSTVFDGLLRTLPNSGLKYVSKILLCQTISTIGVTIHAEDELTEADFGPMWDKLSSEMPEVKDVRIHLEMDGIVDLSCFEFHQFAGVACLPNVRSVQVQLSDFDPAILSTNKLIYKEALPVFYSCVELHVGLPIFYILANRPMTCARSSIGSDRTVSSSSPAFY